MRSRFLFGGATVLLTASIGLHAGQAPQAAPRQGPPTATPPAPGTPAGAPGAPPPGRGGGRGNPMAAKYTEMCSSCHGTSTAKGPVGPSLFDNEWVHGGDDDSIVK